MKKISELDLSECQRQIVEATGKFVVRACPGSGKTYAIAARLLKDAPAWRMRHSGIAALSFTNAAKEELESHLREFGARLPYPHFLGTIDSFINQYIFLPFVHQVVEFEGEVEMIGEPFGRFHSHSYFEEVSVGLKYKDNEYWFKGVAASKSQRKQIIGAKESLLKKGRFTQADANYYALKILRASQRISRSLAARFPYIIVDEAQDSTPIQWEILGILAARPTNVCFGSVGDPDQAIYGWNGASHQLFADHEKSVAEEGGKVITLNESRRSSQAICNFYHPISTLPAVPTAINERVKDNCDHLEIHSYTAIGEVPNLVETVLDSGVGTKETFVLCRETSLIQAILAASDSIPLSLSPWGKGTNPQYLADMILAARYNYDEGNYADAYRQIQRVLAIQKEDSVSDWLTWREWCSRLRDVITMLPSTRNKKVGEWIEVARDALASHDKLKPVKLVAKSKYGGIDYPNLPVSVFFPKLENDKFEVRTIHKVKGRTTDQVILILNERRAASFLKTYQGKKKIDEDTRTLYVALTRARLKNIILVPRSAYSDYQRVFNSAKDS